MHGVIGDAVGDQLGEVGDTVAGDNIGKLVLPGHSGILLAGVRDGDMKGTALGGASGLQTV